MDCCLGGFIVNFLDAEAREFLRMPGVTSLSIDTHKNGWAPKGSSVLITRPVRDLKLREVNLVYHIYYSIPSWPGGLYGSPQDRGSNPVTPTLQVGRSTEMTAWKCGGDVTSASP